MEKQFGAAAGGALFRDGKLLLLRRVATRSVAPGMYEMPGGSIEFGESAQDAAQREFREETGVSVTVGDVYYVWNFITEDGIKEYICVEFMVADVDGGEVVLSDEHDDARWVTEQEMTLLPMSPEMREAAQKAFSNQQLG